ncbi:MAG: hypothetical protein M3041_15480 [Acidobacteriota bacterium]|nr:hypothetical protein [Acidobacteriota bacterium]
MTSLLLALVLVDPRVQPVRVLRANLSAITCEHTTVVPAAPVKCTVSLDAAAADPIAVALNANLPVLSVPATVTINKSADRATFEATAMPIAQSASVQISGTFARVTKSFTVTVLPVALASMSISPATTLPGGGSRYIPMLTLTLTAPPPAAGLKVKLSAQVTASHGGALPVSLPISLTVTQQTQTMEIVVHPVASEMWVAINASSDFFNDVDKKSVTIEVIPAQLQGITVSPFQFSHLPLGGVTTTGEVWLEGFAPEGGATIDLEYSGDTPIIGPSHIEIPKDTRSKYFQVTVSPCSVKPMCIASIGGRYLGKQVQFRFTIAQ